MPLHWSSAGFCIPPLVDFLFVLMLTGLDELSALANSLDLTGDHPGRFFSLLAAGGALRHFPHLTGFASLLGDFPPGTCLAASFWRQTLISNTQ